MRWIAVIAITAALAAAFPAASAGATSRATLTGVLEGYDYANLYTPPRDYQEAARHVLDGAPFVLTLDFDSAVDNDPAPGRRATPITRIAYTALGIGVTLDNAGSLESWFDGDTGEGVVLAGLGGVLDLTLIGLPLFQDVLAAPSFFADAASLRYVDGVVVLRAPMLGVTPPPGEPDATAARLIVDGFRITAIPEPASWALALIGMATMGGALRRPARHASYAASRATIAA